MKLFFPLIILVIVIVMMSCQDDSQKQEDLALNAAKEYFIATNVTVMDAKRLYLHYCSVCHGNEGKGDGFNSYNLDPKPKSFADSAFLAKADSAYIVEVIGNGGKAVDLSAMMPPYGRTITKEQIDELAKYIMILSRDNQD